MSKTIYLNEYDSPCGKLLIGDFDEQIFLCDWLKNLSEIKLKKRLSLLPKTEIIYEESPLIAEAKHQLNSYFKCYLQEFNLPTTTYGTDFQKEVWMALLDVPYGKTSTYQSMAEKIGRPSATRSVANAIAANPLSIIVPCHRIIGSTGKLTGYAGGLKAKEYLLNLEKMK